MNRGKAAIWLGAIGLVAGLCASCAPEPPPLQSKEKPGDAPVAVLKATGLQGRIEETLKLIRSYEVRPAHGFWTVFHLILGLGPKAAELIDDKNQRINALDYVCSAQASTMRGLAFAPTAFGVDVVTNNPLAGEMHFSQGHQDQFIAEMTQWGLSPDRTFVVPSKDHKENRTYHFKDFINHCKMRASLQQQPPQELSWAIVVIPYYYGTAASWVNEQGEKLTVEKLVQAEVRASVNEAACGGTHRLFGLAWAYHLHLRGGGRTEGVWKEVADHLQKYKEETKKLRNPDGSFSTAFYRGRENDPDLGKRINTTGHMLEWLSLAMTEEEVRQEWMQEAANALMKVIFEGQGRPVPGGGLYHAAHGLLLYYARLYDGRRLGPMEPVIPLPSDGMPWRSARMPELTLPGVFSLR